MWYLLAFYLGGMSGNILHYIIHRNGRARSVSLYIKVMVTLYWLPISLELLVDSFDKDFHKKMGS